MRMSDNPREDLVNDEITLRGVSHEDSSTRDKLKLAIEKYLYDQDPIGICFEDAKNFDEYRPEADLIVHLLQTKTLNSRTLSALWIQQFGEELTPFKSENDPKIIEMIQSLNQIYMTNKNRQSHS